MLKRRHSELDESAVLLAGRVGASPFLPVTGFSSDLPVSSATRDFPFISAGREDFPSRTAAAEITRVGGLEGRTQLQWCTRVRLTREEGAPMGGSRERRRGGAMGEHLCPGTLDHPDRCQESWFGESSLKVCSGSFMPCGHIPRPNCLTSHTKKQTGPGCRQEGFRLQTARTAR